MRRRRRSEARQDVGGLGAARGPEPDAVRLRRFELGQRTGRGRRALRVIVAVILGGTNFLGGYGTVVGSVLGALLVGLINKGPTLMGLEFSQQQIVRGAIVILAVALARNGPGPR